MELIEEVVSINKEDEIAVIKRYGGQIIGINLWNLKGHYRESDNYCDWNYLK